jgi:hypothetical protein
MTAAPTHQRTNPPYLTCEDPDPDASCRQVLETVRDAVLQLVLDSGGTYQTQFCLNPTLLNFHLGFTVIKGHLPTAQHSTFEGVWG